MKVKWICLPLAALLLLGRTAAAEMPRPVSRGAFITMLYPEAAEAGPVFEDVGPEAACYAAVGEAAARGVVRGEGGLFCPDRLLTRQEAAVFVWRALTWAGRETEPEPVELPFSDAADCAPWAREALLALFRLGALPEREGCICPLSLVEPAEAEELAASLRRLEAGPRNERLEAALLALLDRPGAKGEFSPLLSLPGGEQELYCTLFREGKELCRARALLRNGLVAGVEVTECSRGET